MHKFCVNGIEILRRSVGMRIGQNLMNYSVVMVEYRCRHRVKSSVSLYHTKSRMNTNINQSYIFRKENFTHLLCEVGICSYLSDDADMDDSLCNRDFKTFLRGTDSGKTGPIQVLQSIIQCSQKQIQAVTKEYPELLLITTEVLSKRLDSLLECGLKRDVLKDNLWLLIYKPKEIAVKFNIIQKMALDINVAIPLLHLPTYRLHELSYSAQKDASLVPGKSRIMHFSNVLQCHPKEICKAVAEHFFLQTLPFERISSILDLILEYDVCPKDVLKDMWIFRYNPVAIEKRFKKMHDAGIRRIKPWAVRCSNEIFLNALRRHVETQTTLGSNTSVEEYLAQRLECSIDTIILLGKKSPSILKIHVTKIKEVLDFLFNEDFTTQQICQVPRILCHSLTTTKQRLKEIRDFHHNPTSLMVLCKSKRQYKDYISKLQAQQKQSIVG